MAQSRIENKRNAKNGISETKNIQNHVLRDHNGAPHGVKNVQAWLRDKLSNYAKLRMGKK